MFGEKSMIFPGAFCYAASGHSGHTCVPCSWHGWLAVLALPTAIVFYLDLLGLAVVAVVQRTLF